DEYRRNHRLQISNHVGRVEPDDSQALPFQPFVSAPVLLRILAHRMGLPFHFDHEPGRGAVEIDDAAPDGMLPPELEPVLAADEAPATAYLLAASSRA